MVAVHGTDTVKLIKGMGTNWENMVQFFLQLTFTFMVFTEPLSLA